MAIKITDMDADASVGGGELIPVSDAGSPKSITTEVLKTYVVDAIEAIAAGSSVATGQSLFALQSGVMKPVDIDLVTQRTIDIVWAKAAETDPDSADVMLLKDGGSTEKTMTLAVLWTYLASLVAALKIDNFAAADDNTDLDATTGGHGLMPKADKVKLDAIEALADVTDATNVAAAGALLSSNLLDEDAMGTNSATKPASQQSIKAYVDGKVASTAVSVIDIDGATDIGADLVDADLLIVDDGASGSNRKFVASRLWTYIWGKFTGAANKATPVDADIIPIQDSAASNVVKELTLANLSAYILSAIEADMLDISGVTAASSLNDADYILLTQGTTAKTTTVAGISAAIYAAFVAYVTDLDAVTSTADADTMYLIRSGVGKKITIATLKTDLGALVGPTTSTENYVPQWSATAETLKDGLGVRESIRADATADNDHLATERAVRDGLEDTKAEIVPQSVDGTLATGANTDFEPTKLVYAKTCSDSDGDDVIDLHDNTNIGQILTVHLTVKAGSDNAIITPVTAAPNYTTITLDAVAEIATLQWQGDTIGWVILYTDGTVT